MSEVPELGELEPFVSKDLDFLADGETVRQLIEILNKQPLRPPKGDPNPVLAKFNYTTPKGAETSIEVLFTLSGVHSDTVKKRALTVESPALRRSIRLPDLVTLLEAKIHNALSLNQENRQDVKHVRILIHCNRAFLRDNLKAAETGEVSERALINALEALFRVVQDRKAVEASGRFGIDWRVAFPVLELRNSPLERVGRFMQHRFLPAFPEAQ